MNEGYFIEAFLKDEYGVEISYVSSKDLMRELLTNDGYDADKEFDTIGTESQWFYWDTWNEKDFEGGWYDEFGTWHDEEPFEDEGAVNAGYHEKADDEDY